VAPFGLWTVARLQANAHINGIDTTQVIDTFSMNGQVFDQFAVNFNNDEDLQFYRRVRELTGQGLDEYVNVDGIDPSQLDLSFFSPLELTDQQLIGYSGYDYLGNKLANDATFDNFFDIEADGSRNFTVAPFRPIYTAAYIQDKFVFKDIIFNLGLRVDRYDANTKVLKDQFSLYDIQTAQDFYNSINQDLPPGVEADYKVYTTREGSDVVRAFRKGEQWFDEQGTPVNDANIIFGGEVVTPRYSESDPVKRNIQSREFDPDIAFEDYEPVLSWMPRLAFSFPISDDANFFAHYDILVERPQSNAFVSPLAYYYFEDPSRTPANNPNLQPAKTIDYEVGFQQKLSNSSAITLSAYYKELRDMIQRRTLLYIPAPISSYETYGNIDFGTVKGFSFKYDLRRTGNLQLTANYTLQFADGTGSNANSQRGLTSRGNIRNLLPLSFDERHRFVATVDYRYGSGKRYNGPRWFGADIFANAGLNFTATAVSGRPYTRLQTARPFSGAGFQGSINGARLPWNFTVDARADKSFRIGGKEGKRALFLNVYLRVQNVFDTRNIIGVYPVTGSPDDDGYLSSVDGQAVLNSIEQSNRDVSLYLTHYQWSLINPGFFSLPRRAFIGAILDF
ncbi:MAG: outer membrane beta-barrel protein, partial [Bacteroidota bacterium]